MFKRCYGKKEPDNIVIEVDEYGNIHMDKDIEKVIIESIKKSRVEDIKMIDYSINQAESKLVMINKDIDDYTCVLNGIKNNAYHILKTQIEDEYMCQICFANKKNMIMVPCGHMICNKCIPTLNNCFFCRTPVNQVYRVYE